jgi:hypothetical protein
MPDKTTMSRADFFELRFRGLEADVTIEKLKAQAKRIEAARDQVFARMGKKYGFDWQRPFVLEDTDYSVTQASPVEVPPCR